MNISKFLIAFLLICPFVWAGDSIDYNDANCQGAWRFIEGSGVTVADDSQNNNTGDFKDSGEPAWESISGGPSSYATYNVDFDGSDDFVETNYSDTLTQFSIVFWFKTLETADVQVWFGSLGTGANAPTVRPRFETTGDVAILFVRSDNGQSLVVNGTTDINDDAWYHYATVLNSSGDGEVFINGSSENTGSNASLDTFTLDRTFYIGAAHTAAGFASGIDSDMLEVAIFDRTLDSTEINDIMDNGLAPVVVADFPQFISITEN